MLFKAQSRLFRYNNYCLWQVNMINFAGKSNAGLSCNKSKFRFFLVVFKTPTEVAVESNGSIFCGICYPSKSYIFYGH